MHSKAWTELIFQGFEYFMIAALLLFIGYGFSLRSDFAETYNRRVEASNSIRQYLKFAKYDQGNCTGDDTCTGDVYGDELIAVIREYYKNPEFEIYVNKTNENGQPLKVNQVCVDEHPENYTVEHLQDLIGSLSRFHPYLVYNGVYAESVSQEQHGEPGEVTGISFVWVRD